MSLFDLHACLTGDEKLPGYDLCTMIRSIFYLQRLLSDLTHMKAASYQQRIVVQKD